MNNKFESKHKKRKKQLGVRITDEAWLKLDQLEILLADDPNINCRADIIENSIDYYYKLVTGIDLDNKLDYIFEYLELILKTNTELNSLFIDEDGHEKKDSIKYYIKEKSRYRKYVSKKKGGVKL